MYDIQIWFKVTNTYSNDSSQYNSANHLVVVGACLHNNLKHLKQSQVAIFCSTEFMQQMRHVSTIGISWILACQSYCFTKFIQMGIHESYFQKNPVLGRPLNQTGRKKKYFNNLQLHHNPKVSSGNSSDKRIDFFGTGFIIKYACLNCNILPTWYTVK